MLFKNRSGMAPKATGQQSNLIYVGTHFAHPLAIRQAARVRKHFEHIVRRATARAIEAKKPATTAAKKSTYADSES